MNFQEIITSHTPLLIEGSMYDRLKRQAGEDFDSELAHLGLIYSEKGREALKATYEEYIDAARSSSLPIILFTPTWRANKERVARSSLREHSVNVDGAAFLLTIRERQALNSGPEIFIGGLIGCRNDCYNSTQALTVDESLSFHYDQIKQLAESGIDFLFASTLPAVSEATGIAKAMSKTSLPYVLSFVVDESGAVLDGKSLAEAVKEIDSNVDRKPLGYFANCVHPDVMHTGLDRSDEIDNLRNRLIGFQGNTSRQDPRKFDSLKELDSQDPLEFAKATIRLREDFGICALGGCCGTGPEHIREIGRLLTNVEGIK